MSVISITEEIDVIEASRNITLEQLRLLAAGRGSEYLHQRAREVAQRTYGKDIYVRGLIEFTNHCKNDCLYCGIRRSNRKAERYRLTKGEILSCCELGYELGFRTFVLQGGEDGYFTDEKICDLVRAIKESYQDCAVTLSIGEKSRSSYEQYRRAGVDRYLLRHETANEAHYAKLHPAEMSLSHRKECLRNLKELGYQVGAGFMVGSPHQTLETIFEDLQFLRELKPHMVGIGPFIPHHDTPFAMEKAGSCELTLILLSIIRLLLPHVLLPATTALGTLLENGREAGILAGANVIMPNLSPEMVRAKYTLYDNKLCTGNEAAENIRTLKKRIEGIGYRIVTHVGDYIV